MQNFWLTDKVIKDHNAVNTSYRLGHNKFSDWSAVEYEGFLTYKAKYNENNMPFKEHVTATELTPIDWRNLNAVTPIKD